MSRFKRIKNKTTKKSSVSIDEKIASLNQELEKTGMLSEKMTTGNVLSTSEYGNLLIHLSKILDFSFSSPWQNLHANVQKILLISTSSTIRRTTNCSTRRGSTRRRSRGHTYVRSSSRYFCWRFFRCFPYFSYSLFFRRK